MRTILITLALMTTHGIQAGADPKNSRPLLFHSVNAPSQLGMESASYPNTFPIPIFDDDSDVLWNESKLGQTS